MHMQFPHFSHAVSFRSGQDTRTENVGLELATQCLPLLLRQAMVMHLPVHLVVGRSRQPLRLSGCIDRVEHNEGWLRITQHTQSLLVATTRIDLLELLPEDMLPVPGRVLVARDSRGLIQLQLSCAADTTRELTLWAEMTQAHATPCPCSYSC